jgi:hypothetical protein
MTFLSWTFLSCNNSKLLEKPKVFEAFDFSYNNVFSTCFSIKFTQGDTVFIKQHFAPAFSDTLKSNQSYYAILADIDRARLDSFITKTNFTKLDTSYYQDYQDGEEYQFFIYKDFAKKIVYIHSDSIPDELKSFGYWIVDLKKNLKLFKIDTAVIFGSVTNFLQPTVPAPPIKFTRPKTKLQHLFHQRRILLPTTQNPEQRHR